jgi:hypothetical protein
VASIVGCWFDRAISSLSLWSLLFTESSLLSRVEYAKGLRAKSKVRLDTQCATHYCMKTCTFGGRQKNYHKNINPCTKKPRMSNRKKRTPIDNYDSVTTNVIGFTGKSKQLVLILGCLSGSAELQQIMRYCVNFCFSFIVGYTIDTRNNW